MTRSRHGAPRLTFRRATAADAPSLAALAVAGFETYRSFAPRGWPGPAVEEESARMAATLAQPGTWCEMACDAQGLAGHVGWLPAANALRPVADPALAHLWQLFVRQDRWGTGLAPRLHGAAISAAAERGFVAMRLYTPAAHGRARRFYEREGWATWGEPRHDAAFGMTIVEYRRPLTEVAPSGEL